MNGSILPIFVRARCMVLDKRFIALVYLWYIHIQSVYTCIVHTINKLNRITKKKKIPELDLSHSPRSRRERKCFRCDAWERCVRANRCHNTWAAHSGSEMCDMLVPVALHLCIIRTRSHSSPGRECLFCLSLILHVFIAQFSTCTIILAQAFLFCSLLLAPGPFRSFATKPIGAQPSRTLYMGNDSFAEHKKIGKKNQTKNIDTFAWLCACVPHVNVV